MNAQSKIRAHGETRPASAVSGGVGVAGLLGLAGWTWIARAHAFDGHGAALCALLACGVPMILWSLLVGKVHRNSSTGIDWARRPRPLSETLDTSFTKIVGLWATWAGIACLYCIARWYWDGDYVFAMTVLGYGAVPLLLLSAPYLIWLDRRLVEPRDGAWHFGQWLAGHRHHINGELLEDHLRSWAVKGFFLAFMISILPGNWAEVIRAPTTNIVASPYNLSRWLISVMFMVDVSFATVGYILTLRPLDAHIRSTNPYASGWVAALICYPPFILMGNGGPLDYHPGTADWSYWLADSPFAIAAVGIILVALTLIYAWATVAFGLRFSNLTNRGILTHGPYAWTKHPAYVSKNLFWWLATLPFLATSGNPVDMIRNTVILALVTGVYYWRARTEERHLMADPAYRDYAAWMEQNAPLPRLIAKLRSKAARAPLPAE